MALLTGSLLLACSKSYLKETPLAFMNVESTLTNKAGFESAITALHIAARDLYFNPDGPRMHSMQLGTDVAMNGDPSVADFVNYTTWLTPAATTQTVNELWDWGYTKMIPRANTIIEYADKPQAVWASEAEKAAIVAEARFFRAWTYNFLAKLYGGVPVVDKVYTEDKRDFVRATRQQVWDFARQDLEYASQWLPVTTAQKGRIVKGAADHLLAEVYISLGQYDKAIASATAVINGPYKIMTSRFGNYSTVAGDVYSDLFKDNNQNLAANTETIWAVQFEYATPGGITTNASGGNATLRAWGNRYWNLKDPDGKAGMVVADSLGRGVGWVRGTNYFFYDVWNEDPNDMRNSRNNIRRDFYFNNPASRFLGLKVDPNNPKADTAFDYYPTIRKIEGLSLAGASYGRTFKEHYVMRLAETYLLRAEAYLRKGDLQKAADDINVVRSRAAAKAVTAARVDLDYILDERARELIIEEPRRLTLSRMGKLVERVKKYNPRSAAGIQPYHELYPIPQKIIDANSGAKMEQNAGY